MKTSYRYKLEKEKLALTKLESAIYTLDDVIAQTQEDYRKEIIRNCRNILVAVKTEIEKNEFMMEV